MKTTIEFTDGRVETFENSAPVVDTEELTLGLVGPSMIVASDDVPLSEVARVVFDVHLKA